MSRDVAILLRQTSVFLRVFACSCVLRVFSRVFACFRVLSFRCGFFSVRFAAGWHKALAGEFKGRREVTVTAETAARLNCGLVHALAAALQCYTADECRHLVSNGDTRIEKRQPRTSLAFSDSKQRVVESAG